MCYEDVERLVEEYTEPMSPGEADEIHKFANDCLTALSFSDIKNYRIAQRILKLYDSHARRERFNNFIKQINPHLDPNVIWES